MIKVNEIVNVVSIIAHDQVVFWLLQLAIILFLIYAVFKSLLQSHRNKSGSVHCSIKRGKESVGRFHHFAVFFITVVLAVVFSISEVVQGYKTLFYLINVAIVLYLSYWNNWFRNKLVGWYSMIKNKKEE